MKTNTLFLTTVLSLAVATTFAQISFEKTLEPFKAIEAGSSFNIELYQGNESKVVVDAKKGDPSKLSFKIKGDKLVIEQGDYNGALNDVIVKITSPQFEDIDIHGAVDLMSKTPLTGNKLKIELSGASDADLEVNVKELDTDLSGSSDLKIKGTATEHKADVSGASNLKAVSLVTQRTIVDVSGAGDAKINAVEELVADISGAASVSYKDEPKQKNINVSGAGDIYRDKKASIVKGDSTATRVEINAYGGTDTTRFRFKDKRIIIIDDEKEKAKNSEPKKDEYHHWLGFDVGVNGYTGDNYASLPKGYEFLDLNYGRSFNFRLNFAERDINIYQEKVNIVTGLGIEWANYGFKNSTVLNPNSNVISATDFAVYKYGTNINTALVEPPQKNKLRAIYLNVPLLLEFNTSNTSKKSAHLAAGVIGGYRMAGSYILKYNGDRTKTKDDFNMSRFKLAAAARVGYGNFTVFADYNLTSLFKNSEGPNTYPFTVGISVIPFN